MTIFGHCVPKLPECLKICQHCHSNQLENENHFLFHCDRYKTIRQQITSDIVLKYPLFNLFKRGVKRFSDRRIWPQKSHGLWIFAVNRADWRILKTLWIVDQL